MTICRAARPLVLLALTGPAQAAPVQVAIDPRSTSIAYTVFALGMFPVEAHFTRFQGALAADPADPARCDVHVVVQVDSLQMADAARTQLALGPTMLDAARFPTMRFDGRCAAGGVSGRLTLHGTTRPLTLEEHRTGASVVSSAMLRRQDFGVSGLPYLVGAKVRIEFTTRLPQAFAQGP